MDLLNSKTTLVLNAFWQPIGEKTAAEALCRLYSGAFSALDISPGEEEQPNMVIMNWEQWEKLAVKSEDIYILSTKGRIKIPHVIISKNYKKIHFKQPKLTFDAIIKRDKQICQYSGRKIDASEISIDHVIPLSKGGKNTWDNLVCCDKKINNKKSNKTPKEAGLSLIRAPFEPKPVVASSFIQPRNKYWEPFL